MSPTWGRIKELFSDTRSCLVFSWFLEGKRLARENELMEEVERGTFCGSPTDLKAMRSPPCLQFEVALCSQSRELLLTD